MDSVSQQVQSLKIPSLLRLRSPAALGWGLGMFRAEAGLELDRLLSLEDESFNCCLFEGDSFSGLPGLPVGA